MPLVTDLWFTAFNRILLWRLVFTLSAAVAFGFLVVAPIIWHNIDKFGLGWRLLWTALLLIIALSGWRWTHWRRIQKANILG